MASQWHLAQLNIAHGRYPLDAPEMEDFRARLDEINALAEASQGFVWRLKDDAGAAMSFRLFDDPKLLINLTVWTTPDALSNYVYRTAHAEPMRLRKRWFEPAPEATFVLWWIPAGTTPSLVEAGERLLHLRKHGPTAEAFTFKDRFPPRD